MARLAASDYQITSLASNKFANVRRIICLLFVCSLRVARRAQRSMPPPAPKTGALAGRRPVAQILWKSIDPYSCAEHGQAGGFCGGAMAAL
jgi:hypothetical protein